MFSIKKNGTILKVTTRKVTPPFSPCSRLCVYNEAHLSFTFVFLSLFSAVRPFFCLHFLFRQQKKKKCTFIVVLPAVETSPCTAKQSSKPFIILFISLVLGEKTPNFIPDPRILFNWTDKKLFQKKTKNIPLFSQRVEERGSRWGDALVL